MFIGIMRNMKELAIYSRADLEVKVLKMIDIYWKY